MFTRLFDLFATAMLANFQDRLVMTTSISLRKYDATACIIFTEPCRWGSASLLVESTSHTPLGDRQARLSGAECGYLRHRRTIPLMHTVHFHRIFNFFRNIFRNAIFRIWYSYAFAKSICSIRPCIFYHTTTKMSRGFHLIISTKLSIPIDKERKMC